MKVLLLVGAGTSVELGVPAMAGLAEEFIEHADQWKVEPQLVRDLLGETLDIEHLIERLDQICAARESLESIGQMPEMLDRADALRAEVEWFVQHAAERVISREAQLLWGPVLRSSSECELTIVSTNYDRAIELAANAERIPVDDGYGSFETGETAEWNGFKRPCDGVSLVKLHGSTDWYLEKHAGVPKKLRHPMPLFGRASLMLPIGVELGSALILPSREKLLTRQPYPRLSQAFLNAADECDVAIVVGSSLRDHHLRGAMESVARRVPAFLVNRRGSTYGLDGVVGLPQTASAFLSGTVPRALRSGDVAGALRQAAIGPPPQAINCLRPLARALDCDGDEEVRCAALDELESAGICIDSEWLCGLIADPSARVAQYSLGFVTEGPDTDRLLQSARSCSHANEGSPFRKDLELLEHMLNRSVGGMAAKEAV